MKRFFDLSILLLLPIFLFSTLNNETVTTEPVSSSEAQEIFELISAEGITTVSLEDVQSALEHKETSEALLMPLCGNVECYTASWLTRFLSVYGECNLVAPYDCFDVDDNDCINQVDLSFFLANFCD